jgi:hypothetical protein
VTSANFPQPSPLPRTARSPTSKKSPCKYDGHLPDVLTIHFRDYNDFNNPQGSTASTPHIDAAKRRSIIGIKASVSSVGTNEDDLCQAAEGMDEMEVLSELVAAFEQTAFETKKRVNTLDRMAYTAQLLPPTLRVCFQTLVRSNK